MESHFIPTVIKYKLVCIDDSQIQNQIYSAFLDFSWLEYSLQYVHSSYTSWRKRVKVKTQQLSLPEGSSHLHSFYLYISRTIASLYNFSICCVIFLPQEHSNYFASIFLALLHPCPIWVPRTYQQFFYEVLIPLILVLWPCSLSQVWVSCKSYHWTVFVFLPEINILKKFSKLKRFLPSFKLQPGSLSDVQ